ncbi:hypothetical protein V4D06_19130 [Vibrio mimicus]|uniref:hypothetical protein n=1 Tax=Vibrio mimicus TaxID=674 RepID=UPI002F956B66
MRLPQISAASVSASFVAVYNYFISDNDGNDEDLKSELSKTKEKELDFIIRLATTAAYADGEMNNDEKEIIIGYIESYQKNFKSSDFFKKLDDILDKPCDMNELHQRWEALESKNKDEWEKIIKEIIGADNQYTDCEKAFLFRCNLMINGFPDQKLFMLTDDGNKKSTLSLEYIQRNNLPYGCYINKNTLNEFLVVHPAHIKSEERELIPISEFFSDSFLTSQDTELVNAARIAGAKKVTIFTDSKQASSISSELGLDADASCISSKAEVNVSDIYSDSDKKVIVYEFKGSETSLMRKLKSAFNTPEREILRNSKWLQYDSELTEFVRSCFSENKLTYFSREISTETQRNVIHSAKIATKCNLIKVNPEVNLSLERKEKLFQSTEKKYVVEF